MIRPNDGVQSAAPVLQPVRAPQAAAPAPAEATPSASLESTATVSVDAARENVEDSKADLKSVVAGSAGEGAAIAGPGEGTAASSASDTRDGAKPTPEESYRTLIAADIKSAYGREATDEDYKYWLGKLEGPNDSGFVTSGKMTATEYWHRRMLGWQAGGADVATSGPYAGGGGPHGDVPAATDIVPSVPPGGVYNQASPQRIDELRFVIDSDIRTAYGREATDEDYGYWLNKFLGENDSSLVTSGSMSSDEYWHRRLLGWQAGGEDVAARGPFAGSGDDIGRPVLPVDRLFETYRSAQGGAVG